MKNFALFVLLLMPFTGISQTLTQNVKGRVIDKQTQVSLPGALIVIKNSDPITATTSDLDGHFILENLTVGRYDFTVSFFGYEEIALNNILVTTGKEVFLYIEMQQNVISLKTVVITSGKKEDAINNRATISARTFSVEETERYAGSRADPARMASNYAGVVGGGDMRNDIIVRGNSPSGILWRMDGLEIPNPNHYSFAGTSGGLFSMLNNNLLSNSDFITGAFPAEYGNKNAAVFDLKMRNGNNENREYIAQIGLNGLEFGAEGGFSKNSRASYLINYRLFSLKPAKKLGIDFKSSGIPNFQDLSFKINIPTKKLGRLSLFGIGGTSNLSLLDSEREPEDWDAANNDDITFGSNTGFIGATHSYSFGNKSYGKFSFLMAGSQVSVFREFVFLDKPSMLKEDLQMINSYLTFKYEFNHKVSTKHFLKTGISYQPKYYKLYQKEMDDNDSTIYHVNFDDKGNTGLTQSYMSWQYRPSNNLTINSGIHVQFLQLNNSYAIEPRFGLKYQLSENKKIAFGYGLHSQMLPIIFYTRNYTTPTGTTQQTNKNLDFSKSHHFVLGYDQSFKSDFRLKAEVYYQHLFHVPVSETVPYYSTVTQGAEFSFWIPDSLKNTGTGSNYGLELTLEKFFSNNYYFLLTTSLFESKYIGGTGQEYNSPFSLGYIANALVGYELPIGKSKTKAIIVDFKTTLAGGKRYIPIALDQSIQAESEILDTDRAYQDKFNDFLKTDIKISYRSNRKKATHFTFIAIDNVFNNKNILAQHYNNETKEVDLTYQLGLFPYFGYRLQFWEWRMNCSTNVFVMINKLLASDEVIN